MARIAYGAGFSGLSQSTAGVTFLQHGPTGVVRVKRATAKVREFYSLQNRAYFLTLVALWQSASMDAHRADWLALGGSRRTIDVFGNPVPLNGLGSFIRYNLPLLQNGIAPNTTPPTDFTATTLTAFTIDALSGPQTIKLTALTPNIAANEALIIAVSTTRPPGYISLKRRPRTLARVAGPVSLPVDFSTRWIQYGGILLSGTALIASVRVLNTDSGFYSPKLLAMVAVT